MPSRNLERPIATCPVAVLPNRDRGWLDREPTVDEQEIVAWMKRRPLPRAILHVGIGNALLRHEFGDRVTQGLTRDGGEAEVARALGMATIVCNKYDLISYERHLLQPFDCIVDANIRSYACCDEHFQAYMARMLAALQGEGSLLTSSRGLEYLVPTTLEALRSLCPDWRIRQQGNVVVMGHRRPAAWRRWFERASGSNRVT